MNPLDSIQCEICQVGAPQATEVEIAEFLPQIPQWQIIDLDGVNQLKRKYTLTDFKAALAFTNLVGELAESEDHHPEIITEWGKVTVSWWTHKIKGLHVNDFVMAAKTDQLLDR